EQLEVRLNEASKQNPALMSDTQEFGDRLDVLVADVETGRALVLKQAEEAKIAAPEIEVSEPNLENVFVSTLKGSAD
ncbi:hypothetical protein, partial [Staphylococcus aureus]